FQINSLFPNLNALEAVTLAICERESASRVWWRRIAAHSAILDEAHGILASLMLGADCYRPTRELPYGRQRLLEIALALATRPKVLLLDEPAAGVPRDESAELFAAIANLSRDITVLFIEHDMNFVFRFASRIIVMVGGRVLREGSPEESAADPRACYRPYGCSDAPPRPRRARLGRAGARDLSFAQCGRKSHRRVAVRPLGFGRCIRCVSASRRAARQHGQSALGRRATDARDR